MKNPLSFCFFPPLPPRPTRTPSFFLVGSLPLPSHRLMEGVLFPNVYKVKRGADAPLYHFRPRPGCLVSPPGSRFCVQFDMILHFPPCVLLFLSFPPSRSHSQLSRSLTHFPLFALHPFGFHPTFFASDFSLFLLSSLEYTAYVQYNVANVAILHGHPQ